ncbi:MAG: VPS10 domain-containing protein [Thermoanaerobaculum sp.]
MNPLRSVGVALCAVLASNAWALTSEQLFGLRARSIGPATMSGRVAAIEGVAGNPVTVYVGAATGGVWKSTDGGLTFKPIFDREKVAAIGAVAVSPTNPDVVWVGTGEGNPRNSASVGYGVWLSRDGGQTWKHVGLEKTERVARIVPHPKNPEVAYVCAMGHMWGENPDRGVFKTTDGGRTWKKVLFVDDATGCADLIVDPTNPDKLFAAMWTYRRWPYFFKSGGPGSGLFLTYDGGESWKKLSPKEGLPEGDLGRIGLALCAAKPNVVYALVEAKTNVLLRSDDGGETFAKVNEGARVGNRPFYYADIVADPVWPNRLYDLATRLSVSDDGGKTFRPLATGPGGIHSDFHAMWINPENPEHLIVGNDGGVAISYDRGGSWRYVPNLPLAQYYHVNVDMDRPYHVYGGLQDNGSWRGPSAVWETGGIRNHHWQEVGFGDGFDVSPDPEDSMRGYSMSQEGYLRRFDLRTGEQKDIRPAGPRGVKLRFNWNAGFAQDPFDPATIYFGSQFVHRSRDRGDSWEIISPDLTTNNPEWQKQADSGGLTPDVTGAENYTTILTIAPSPVQRGVIWVGTDDGRIHVTRDGGQTWVSVEKNVKGVPANTWVPHIEASKHAPGRAYVVFDDHRRSNWTPYLYVTEDFGATWKPLNTGGFWGYCLVVEEDPVNENLLFVGTEFGLYVSQDRGKSFWRFENGLPTVSVMDLAVHPREHDLVIATHGRGLFIVDDISPLRGLTDETLSKPLHLFPLNPAQQYRKSQGANSRFPGDTEFVGENRPYGALVTFVVNDPELSPYDPKQNQRQRERRGEDGQDEEKKNPEATITVSDANGQVVRTFKVPVYRGLNRAVWDLRRDPFKEPPREEQQWWRERGGPEVPPGKYTVTVAFKGQKAQGVVEVLPDPRSSVPAEAVAAKWQAIKEAGALQEALADGVAILVDLREDLKTVAQKLGKGLAKDRKAEDEEAGHGPKAELKKRAEQLARRTEEIEKLFRVPPGTKGIVDLGDALTTLREAAGGLQSSWDAPTPAQLATLAEGREKLEKALAVLQKFLDEEIPPFREAVAKEGVTLLAQPKLPELPASR